MVKQHINDEPAHGLVPLYDPGQVEELLGRWKMSWARLHAHVCIDEKDFAPTADTLRHWCKGVNPAPIRFWLMVNRTIKRLVIEHRRASSKVKS